MTSNKTTPKITPKTTPDAPRFIPVTLQELKALGWDRPDVVLVTGDAYIDAPSIGAAVIGRVLTAAGYRVGIIPQPDLDSEADIGRLGEPTLFWGVTGGCVDSMVANYTASGKRRKSDDMTPGGQNTRRPDRAVIAYSNLIRRFFKDTRPIVLGGVEASLRRVSHYDAKTDGVRRSILFDAKADILVYGMGEGTVLDLADALRGERDIRKIRGICYISREEPAPEPAFSGPDIGLPDHETVVRDKAAFARMFKSFYENADPITAKRLYQKQDTRHLVQNPPAPPPSSRELDRIHDLPFTRDPHPIHREEGRLAAVETIRFSLATHRGCYGECRFCAIAVHQGRHVVSRTEDSLIREASGFARHPEFKGIISDVGGPTANMYGIECTRKGERGVCREKGCLFPRPCKHLSIHHGRQIDLLRVLRKLPHVRKVFIGSGIRYDMILADREAGGPYLSEILRHHVSGQLKIAPEHSEGPVLKRMGKPGREALESFLELFRKSAPKTGPKQFLTYYLMAAHPGCTQKHMEALRAFCLRTLRLLPEQIQIFTPTPATWSTLMYHTGTDPFTGERLFVEKHPGKKERQKAVMAPPKRRRKSG